MTTTVSTAPVSTGPPFLSFAERDRRYAAMRAKMKEQNLDVLILPASTTRWDQSMADSRYASGIGGFGTETLTIVPLDGEPTAYLFNRSGWWKGFPGNWLSDVRDGRNHFAKNIIEKLEELHFTTGIVGISGLGGANRTPDGTIPSKTVDTVKAAFPHATFVDASALIQDLRSIKSAEEVAVLERAAAITDTMVAAMVNAAKPGVTERHVHAAIAYAMLEAGGELPSLFIFASGPGLETGHGSFVPTERVLERGDLLVNELEGRVAGYGAQTVAPVWVGGTPDPRYAAAHKAALACFKAVLAALKPGVTMQGLMDVYYATLKTEANGKFTGSFPLMHARGLGDEVPAVIDAKDLENNGGATIRENMVFVLKPRVREAGGSVSAQVGDTVVCTPSGGRRLGKRSMELDVA